MINYTRQLGILDPEKIHFPVMLIGCGGINSFTALTLAKMGCPELLIVDEDDVEAHNIPNQLFRPGDIDKGKAEASRDILSEFTDCNVRIAPKMFEYLNHWQDQSVIISGVDTMAARKRIWGRIRMNRNVPFYIDGRIGGEIIEVLSVRPCQIDDVDFYEEWLFSDDDVAPLPCTAKAVAYVGFVIAGFIGAQFKKWINGEKVFRRFNFDLKTMTSIMHD